MADAAKPARPSKRDVIVIDDDDSIIEEPAAKNVKIEEEQVPSPDVVELQQKVLKLEDMFQRACRAARTAELRAEAAENRLDSKYGVKDDFHSEKKRADELEMRLTAVSSKMEGTRRKADNDFSEKTELAREKESLKEELDELKRSTAVNLVANRAIMSELAERMNCLTNRLEDERKWAIRERARDHSRINELTNRLARYEAVPPPPLQLQAQQFMPFQGPPPMSWAGMPPSPHLQQLQHPLPPAAEHRDWRAAASAAKAPELELHEIGHPTNIYQLCRPGSIESIPLDTARERILCIFEKIDGKTLTIKLKKCFSGLPQMSMVQHCDACGARCPSNKSIIEHFLSKRHYRNVSALGGAVSNAALKYWMDMLTPLPEVQPVLQQLTAAAIEAKVDNALKNWCSGPVEVRSDAQPVHQKSTSAAAARPLLQQQKPAAAAGVAPARPMQQSTAAVVQPKEKQKPSQQQLAAAAVLKMQQHKRVTAPEVVARPMQLSTAADLQSKQEQQPQLAAAAARPMQQHKRVTAPEVVAQPVQQPVRLLQQQIRKRAGQPIESKAKKNG